MSRGRKPAVHFASLRALCRATGMECRVHVERVIGREWTAAEGRYLLGADALGSRARERDALLRIEALREAIDDARTIAATPASTHSSAAEIALRRIDARLEAIALDLDAHELVDDKLTQLQAFLAQVDMLPIRDKFTNPTDLAKLWIASGGFPNIGASKWQTLDPTEVINNASSSVKAARRALAGNTKRPKS